MKFMVAYLVMIALHRAEGKKMTCTNITHNDTCSSTTSVYGYSCSAAECIDIMNVSISEPDLEPIWNTTSTTINITLPDNTFCLEGTMIVNVTCWTKNEQLVNLLGDISLQRPEVALYPGNQIDINHHIEFSPIILVCNASKVSMDTDFYITFYGPTGRSLKWDCPLKPPHVIKNFTDGFTARVDQVCILYIINATQRYHSGDYKCQVALQQNGSLITQPECYTLDSNTVKITIQKYTEQPNNSQFIIALIVSSTISILIILPLFIIIIGLLMVIRKHRKEKNQRFQDSNRQSKNYGSTDTQDNSSVSNGSRSQEAVATFYFNERNNEEKMLKKT